MEKRQTVFVVLGVFFDFFFLILLLLVLSQRLAQTKNVN